jgi:hypothetical protein
MAAHMNRHFCPLDILDDEKLTFSSGTTAMVEMLAHTLGDHGATGFFWTDQCTPLTRKTFD